MINFMLRKMWKNKWLLLCLLAGNILLIGITASTPMYSNATLTRMVHQAMRLRQVDEGIFPAFTRLTFHNATGYTEGEAERTLRSIDIPAQTVKTYRYANWEVEPAVTRDIGIAARTRRINLLAKQNAEEHITLIHGRKPAITSGLIEVMAMEAAMAQHNLLLGELLRVEDKPDVYLKVVGIFEPHEQSGAFWAITSPDFTRDLLVHEDLVLNFPFTISWHNVHDYLRMTGANTRRYMDALTALQDRYAASRDWTFYQNFYETLEQHVERAAEFNLTLIILQVPIYFLLAFYIYVVSRKILQLEQNEISILKSRGASRLQILGLYIGQGLIVGLIAYPAGIAFGVGICHLLGASSGFLELMSRSQVVVEISSQALVFGGVASVFSFCAMVLPVIRFSKVGIVEFKRGKDGKLKKALWQRYFLDIFILSFSVYVIWTFNVRESDFIDPTLFLSSTMFMIGLGLFCLRIFPYIIKFLFFIGRRFMPISLYTAAVRVSRSSGEEQFIMIFLVFTMAIGIFSAQAARTVNLNAEHETRYLGGTDIVFRELWLSNFHQFMFGQAGDLLFTEPSLTRLEELPEIEAKTRVQNELITGRRVRGGERLPDDIQLMAIETQSFGEVSWFRDDLLPIHLNYYLNVLSQVPNGVLLSENFRSLGFVLGDTIILEHTWLLPDDVLPLDFQRGNVSVHSETSPMVIVGFLERFPTFVPTATTVLAGGNTILQHNNLAVGNLGFFQHEWGIWPYEVWIRTNAETSQFFHDFIQENELRPVSPAVMFNSQTRGHRSPFVTVRDVNNAVAQTRLDPLIQGTNGVLTVNFIATLLICFSGFLIYWLLSIRERTLQFGIFRAMGMRIKSIIAMLIHEQILITLTALIIGAAVGELTARLYVPLIQLAYSNQIIPLQVAMETRDYATLYAVMAAMIVICVAVLISFISKIRIDQALKLGED